VELTIVVDGGQKKKPSNKGGKYFINAGRMSKFPPKVRFLKLVSLPPLVYSIESFDGDNEVNVIKEVVVIF